MQNEILKLIGKSYKKDTQVFFVKDIQIKNNILIQTDKKAIIVYNTEHHISQFLSEIEIIETVVKEFIPPAGLAVSKEPVYIPEVIVSVGNSEKISNALMSVFDELCNNPSDDTYKKAKAISDVANTVVNVQMSQIRLLTLKK